MENSYENSPVGTFMIEDGIGDYKMELTDNGGGRFKLNGTDLLVFIQVY